MTDYSFPPVAPDFVGPVKPLDFRSVKEKLKEADPELYQSLYYDWSEKKEEEPAAPSVTEEKPEEGRIVSREEIDFILQNQKDDDDNDNQGSGLTPEKVEGLVAALEDGTLVVPQKTADPSSVRPVTGEDFKVKEKTPVAEPVATAEESSVDAPIQEEAKEPSPSFSPDAPPMITVGAVSMMNPRMYGEMKRKGLADTQEIPTNFVRETAADVLAQIGCVAQPFDKARTVRSLYENLTGEAPTAREPVEQVVLNRETLNSIHEALTSEKALTGRGPAARETVEQVVLNQDSLASLYEDLTGVKPVWRETSPPQQRFTVSELRDAFFGVTEAVPAEPAKVVAPQRVGILKATCHVAYAGAQLAGRALKGLARTVFAPFSARRAEAGTAPEAPSGWDRTRGFHRIKIGL